jgi:serine/threonine-protein kinase
LQQISLIYYAALEREPDDRKAFLHEACAGDERLLHEVESLLAHDAAPAMIDAPAMQAAAKALGTESVASRIGMRVGIYEIGAFVGAGGMGEVYRARDTKLGRSVALKVMPELWSDNVEWRVRFDREARLLASLNHPNIAQIYGIEESSGVRAIAMEFVDGETLDGRLKSHVPSVRGARSVSRPIPHKEALALATQIADALDAAHQKGIVHRDLKPANIKLTPDRRVKVLDFGLAKLVDPLSSTDDVTTSTPTSKGRGTREGVLLGTPSYMSPEQARGQPVDKRADIWAFGCVLFEMLAGRPAFAGETVSDTVVAVLEHSPDWTALPPELPASTRRLLRQCLEKDRQQRLRDIGDARLWLVADSEPGPPARLHRDMRWKVATGALAVLVGTLLVGRWFANRPVTAPSIRLQIDLGPDVVNPLNGPPAILSPDGTRLVYRVRNSSGRIQLVARELDRDQQTLLPGTVDANGPFFSPDGHSIGFFANRRLKRVSLDGGEAVDLCAALDPRGGSWGDDDTIVASLGANGPLYRIPADGGIARPITDLKQAVTHRLPQVLPGSRAVLFTANTFVGDFDQATIEIQSLTSNERKTLVRGGYYGRFAPSGHLLYMRGQTLYAAEFDPKRWKLGAAAPIIQGVRTRISAGAAGFFVSQNGTLIYSEGHPLAFRLAWLGPNGHTEPLPAAARADNWPVRFSSDGRRVAVAKTEAGSLDIWVYELEHGGWTRLTSSPGIEGFPVWTPDGSHIAFVNGAGEIAWLRADGGGDVVQLTRTAIDPGGSPSPHFQRPYSFSPDGKWLVFEKDSSQTKIDVWALQIENAKTDHPEVRTPVPILMSEYNEQAPMISPDGRWLAYQSDETGTDQVYVRPFPGPGGKWPISTGGGSHPVWSKNHELFFRGPDGMMVANYSATSAAFDSGTPRLWATKRGLSQWFDLSPDGQRFIVVENDSSDEPSSTQVTFVLNFFEQLRRRFSGSQ